MEFLHSDNFVQAHIKAAEAMAEDDSPVVSLESFTGMCEGWGVGGTYYCIAGIFQVVKFL